MKIAFSAVPVPPAPLSFIQRDYYFYLFASRIKTVLSHLDERDFSRFRYLEPVHLGLLALIAHLEQKGHKCSYFAPLAGENPEKREEILVEKILERADEFEIIGFSPITASWPAALRMAKEIKNKRPDKIIAVGGPHVWAKDREILENTPFDIVVRKEGEETTAELLDALDKGRSPENIRGLSFIKDGRFCRNPDRDRMDRKDLPMPDYGHLEDNFSPDELAPENRIMIPVARVTPSTGCANNCVWCADFWKKDVYYSRDEVFRQEVDYLIEERGSRYFYLGTHDFFHDIDSAMRIAETMGGIRREMHWEAQTRVNTSVSRKILEDLASSDCRCLHVGIESGSQELLDEMGKNIVLKEARKMCEMAREAGIHTHTYWIIGVPYETRKSAMETIRLMKEWLMEDISSSSEINLLVGYPGTYFYENPEKFNITRRNPDFQFYDGRSIPTFSTADLTVRDTEYLFHRALDEYCDVMAGKMGEKEAVIKELGKRVPGFDPAVMEAAF